MSSTSGFLVRRVRVVRARRNVLLSKPRHRLATQALRRIRTNEPYNAQLPKLTHTASDPLHGLRAFVPSMPGTSTHLASAGE